MRKRDLIQQNLSLFETLQKTQLELSDLKKQIKSYADEISILKEQIASEKIDEKPPVTEPMRRLEKKVIDNANLKLDMEYGANVIGQIVVLAAEYSNKLTLGGDDSRKELVNLVLGKTEMAKAEILTVIQTEDSLDIKRSKIDQISAVTKEYFESVMAQIV